ncbi:MAG: hypothetical protein K2K91_09495 [Ruminococcus sp.]|nr:hypothetical protein [Ruminococcus sp.]
MKKEFSFKALAEYGGSIRSANESGSINSSSKPDMNYPVAEYESEGNIWSTNEILSINSSDKPYMNHPDVKNTLEYLCKINGYLDKQIQKGREKDTASTGIPMEKLKGGAYDQASDANVGDGSKEHGGKGTKGGREILRAKAFTEGEIIGYIKGLKEGYEIGCNKQDLSNENCSNGLFVYNPDEPL